MKTTLNVTEKQPNKWLALAVLCTAQFMVIMDTSIIGVALPAIQKSLNYSAADLQWIFNAYVIALGGILLLGGKLSDLFGPKKIFLWGFGILTISSLFTGLAWDDMSMNIGRAVQGFGAALIAPSALTLLMTIFTDPKELGKAFGFWGAAAAAGGSAGVFLGGLLTEYLSWRWTFFINIPLGVVVMIFGYYYLIRGNKNKNKIDYLGAVLITGSITLLVYTLTLIDKNGWTSSITLGYFGITFLLFILFIISQRKSKSPLIPFSIFKVPNLSAGNIIMLLMAGSWIPLWFYLNLYLQQSLNYSAFYSGLALLPMTIAIMIIMVGITGKLITKYGLKPILVTGLIVLTLSLIWFSYVPLEGNFLTHVLGASILGAIGMSLAYIPGTMISMAGAKPEETGLASGLVNTTYQVGSAIGLALVVVMALYTTNNEIASGVAEKVATNSGFQTAFCTASIISGVSILIAVIGIKKLNNQ